MVAYADRQRQLEAGFRKRDFIPERRIDFSGEGERIWHKRPLNEGVDFQLLLGNFCVII